MAENSAIEWTHHTFNPWRGCTKVSAGCANCYAETMSHRNPKTLGIWGVNGTRVVAAESYWKQPVKWNETAGKAGERHRVFCASLADVFEGRDTMPQEYWEEIDAARARLFELIDATPNLDWLLLTKRPENIVRMTPPVVKRQGPTTRASDLPRRNIWLGTSVENQEAAERRIPELLKVPAAVRFLSCEPLLGPVSLRPWLLQTACDECTQGTMDQTNSHLHGACLCDCHPRPSFHWVIVGGESGSGARPMHPDWVRDLRDQCVAAGVAFFFKQHGEFVSAGEPAFGTVKGRRIALIRSDGSEIDPASAEARDENGDVATLSLVGKKSAGRQLDGREWNELPKVGS